MCDVIGVVPERARARMTARGAELSAKETVLRGLRQGRGLVQRNIATALGISQSGVSRLEASSDMLISTARSYVEALGGSLKLVVKFPDRVAVITALGEAGRARQNHPAQRGRRRRRA